MKKYEITQFTKIKSSYSHMAFYLDFNKMLTSNVNDKRSLVYYYYY